MRRNKKRREDPMGQPLSYTENHRVRSKGKIYRNKGKSPKVDEII